MVGFNYEYVSSTDIVNNIKLLTDYSLKEYSILIVYIILTILIIYYIIPTINIYFNFNEKENEKQNKKKMLKQIVMQKDINDEIEKELNIQ